MLSVMFSNVTESACRVKNAHPGNCPKTFGRGYCPEYSFGTTRNLGAWFPLRSESVTLENVTLWISRMPASGTAVPEMALPHGCVMLPPSMFSNVRHDMAPTF